MTNNASGGEKHEGKSCKQLTAGSQSPAAGRWPLVFRILKRQMRPRTFITLGVVAVLGVVSLMWLRGHSVELVQAVVLNAMLEKLPEDYPGEQVRTVFAETHRRAIADEREDDYLKALILVSQRLEKRHSLTSAEVDDALQLLSVSRPPE